MQDTVGYLVNEGEAVALKRFQDSAPLGGYGSEKRGASSLSAMVESWFERVAPCPWGASVGVSPWGASHGWTSERAASADSSGASKTARPQLYTPEERTRRDTSPWTMVQAVLAPLQFLVCAASLLLIVRYLATGQGYALATGSILLKTVALYAIMVTGSIWEKDVFGKWLFAPAFFWEDVVSMVVLGLQTAYVAALINGWGTPAQQMTIAIAAYGAYAINASQFLMKLRAARLDASAGRNAAVVA